MWFDWGFKSWYTFWFRILECCVCVCLDGMSWLTHLGGWLASTNQKTTTTITTKQMQMREKANWWASVPSKPCLHVSHIYVCVCVLFYFFASVSVHRKCISIINTVHTHKYKMQPLTLSDLGRCVQVRTCSVFVMWFVFFSLFGLALPHSCSAMCVHNVVIRLFISNVRFFIFFFSNKAFRSGFFFARRQNTHKHRYRYWLTGCHTRTCIKSLIHCKYVIYK